MLLNYNNNSKTDLQVSHQDTHLNIRNVQMIHMAQAAQKGPKRPPVIKCNIYKSRLSIEAVRDLFLHGTLKLQKSAA